MGMIDEQDSFLTDIATLISYIRTTGYKITGGELYRTEEQQALHFKAGRSKTMNSNHRLRLAQDLNFFRDGEYINGMPANIAKKILQPIGDFWESLNPKNKWGGNFSSFIDTPHFERRLK